MKTNDMDTPLTRAEFERNFHLLHRQIKDGKFFVQEGLSRSIAGIARVRFLPNGRTDFLSVDESARLQANMMNQFSEDSFHEELREHKGQPDVSASPDHEDPASPVPE